MTPADNTAWRQSADAWVDDTTDVLHCSMPPQVRAHIEELRAEVRRLAVRRVISGAEAWAELGPLGTGPSIYDSNYGRMMRGDRPDTCTCEMVREYVNGYSGPEPAEWEQNPQCPLHGWSLAEYHQQWEFVQSLLAESRAEVARLTAHTQQVEVPHSSAAVLGYSVAGPSASDDKLPWQLTDTYLNTIDLDPTIPDGESVGLIDGECIVAVVRVGADGRIG